MLKNALTSGRFLRWEKFPGFGEENVRLFGGGRILRCWFRGTGPPWLEKRLACLGVKKRGLCGVGGRVPSGEVTSLSEGS